MLAANDGDRFNPLAIWLARSFRGMDLTELAERAHVSRSIISAVENGKQQPFRPSMLAIADALHFPRRFFYREPVVPEPGALHFRRATRVPERAKDHARAYAAVFGRVVKTFGTLATFAAPRLPVVSPSSDPDAIERAAEGFRSAIGFKLDTPIVNAVRASESAGVFVGTFDPGDMPIHGFASAVPVPLIMLSTKASGSRRRFSVMHEVGHLMMHRTSVPEDAESQADRFAGAAIIPRAAFWREFPRPSGDRFDWPAMIAMKRRWGASVQAIVHRAYDLGLISAVQYRTANIHISNYGWKKEEPGEEIVEQPETCVSFIEDLRNRSEIPALCAAADVYADDVGAVMGVNVEEQIETSEVIHLGTR